MAKSESETTKETVSALNDLIAICEDGIQGFRTAAEAVKNVEAKTFLRSHVPTIQRGETELRTAVEKLGATPAEHGHAAATLHRGWINLKSAVGGKDEEAILNEVVRGEETAVEHYRDALKKPLGLDARDLVEKQLRGVEENLARVRMLAVSARAGTPTERPATTPPRTPDARPGM